MQAPPPRNGRHRRDLVEGWPRSPHRGGRETKRCVVHGMAPMPCRRSRIRAHFLKVQLRRGRPQQSRYGSLPGSYSRRCDPSSLVGIHEKIRADGCWNCQSGSSVLDRQAEEDPVEHGQDGSLVSRLSIPMGNGVAKQMSSLPVRLFVRTTASWLPPGAGRYTVPGSRFISRQRVGSGHARDADGRQGPP